MIRTVDNDVIVLAMAFFNRIEQLDGLYVAFGQGKHFRYISIHAAVNNIGILKCKSLPFFHTITGSDTTSSFLGKGKKSGWKAWQACPSSVTDAFLTLPSKPESISDVCFKEVERFVIVMYSKSCSLTTCDEARRELFTQGRGMDTIPPTSDALLQHVKRCVLQASYYWHLTLVTNTEIPSPSD